MFHITSTPITDDLKKQFLPKNFPDCGSLVSFEGLVRNHNEGLAVSSLEYQCFESMALKVGGRILAAAKEKFPIVEAICLHREGHLQVGETAVWVGVYSHHRGEGFEACRFIIDQVKLLVPIWKKEHYVSHPSSWVACHQCAHPGHHHDHDHGHHHA